jgi:hypothetical protein
VHFCHDLHHQPRYLQKYFFDTILIIKLGDEWISVLKSLVAGDVVNFQAGTHSTGSARAGFIFNGTPTNPITIQGIKKRTYL